MNEKIWTINEILLWTTKYFSEKNIDAPRLTAELLLAKTLSKDRLYLYTNYSQPLNKNELAFFKQLITKRVSGEPTAYILGEKEFWSLKFKVNKNVLIPRPETEVLIEIVNEHIEDNPNFYILEIGTGSGNIPAAISYENKNVKIFSVDISFKALNIAKYNIKANNLDMNIALINSSLLSPFKKCKRFDILISNPPYIKDSDIGLLQNEIKNFEPLTALKAGSDGLFFYKQILTESRNYLKENGKIFFEFGKKEQGNEIKKIMLDLGYKNIVIKNDYSNTPRVIYCSIN
jgi:release factor glutamine methyltransferase